MAQFAKLNTTPHVDARYDAVINPDPFQYLLTSCTVSVPPEVVSELRDIAQYHDIHGAAASNVLAARNHYAVENPYQRAETPGSRPTFGLDDGETDCIVLANTLDVDGVLTGEFGGTNFALVHAALRGPVLCQHRDSSVTTRSQRTSDQRGGTTAHYDD